MKKTLFALLALGSLAMGETTVPLLPSLLDDSSNANMDIVYYGADSNSTAYGAQVFTGNQTITQEKVNTALKNAPLLTAPGWHMSLANGNHASSYIVSTSPTTTETGKEVEVYISANDSFQYKGRKGYDGEIVVSSVSVSSLLSSGNGENIVSSITLGFSTATNDSKFSIWAWDGTTATSLLSGANWNGTTLTEGTLITDLAKDTDISFTAENLALDENDSIVVIWGASSAGQPVNISNITSSVTLVPEPTTATLSLLALAGLAARRRRK